MLDELHTHDGANSKKIKSFDVIPSFTMTTAEITAYLARPSFEGEEFNVYDTTTSTLKKYVYINGAWSQVGSQVILGCVASNNLQYSLDTERVVNGNSSGICKSIKIFKSGTVRVTVEYHLTAGYTGYDGYIQINGVTVYTMPNATVTTYTAASYDATVNFGDTIQFSVQFRNQVPANYYVKNFRIKYDDVVLSEIPDATIIDTSL